MFGLSSMFPPHTLLGVIADDIEKQIGFVISKYVMIYNGEKHTVEFKLNDEDTRRPLPEPALCDGIKAYIEPNLEPGYEIEYAMIYYYRDNSNNLSGIDLHMIKKDIYGNKDRKNETIKI